MDHKSHLLWFIYNLNIVSRIKIFAGGDCHENFGPGGPELAAKIGPPLPKMVRMRVLRSRVL